MAPSQLLQSFFVPDYPKKPQRQRPRITEHGPRWASEKLPFLGKTFVGSQSCKDYFSLLSRTFFFESDEQTFPHPEGFIVDPKAQVIEKDQSTLSGSRGVVSVEGRATFRSVQTKRSWNEQFMYRLSDFDHFGRIGHWEIWADPLSAWDAVPDAPLEESNATKAH